jgi:hypothetical protein
LLRVDWHWLEAATLFEYRLKKPQLESIESLDIASYSS